jgi:hypothetical protein
MIATRKTLIVMTALAAAGLIGAIDMAQSRPGLSPAASVAARFPGADEIMTARNVGRTAKTPAPVVNPAKADRLAPASCVHEHWPYVADECLVSGEGPRPNRPTRIIPIERRAPSMSFAALE